APLSVTGISQATPECGYVGSVRRGAADKSDQWHRRLLRPCHERPRGHAEQRDELAAFHSITSSAVASRPAGMVRPSAASGHPTPAPPSSVMNAPAFIKKMHPKTPAESITWVSSSRVVRRPVRSRGRDASYLAPPAQIRTCSFPAYGSYLGCVTAK